MYVATGYGLGSGRGDSLKSPARVKKIQLLQQQMLSKAPQTCSAGAFVLPLLNCAKTQVQNFDGPAPLYKW